MDTLILYIVLTNIVIDRPYLPLSVCIQFFRAYGVPIPSYLYDIHSLYYPHWIFNMAF